MLVDNTQFQTRLGCTEMGVF